jgi:glutathione S-transferase
VGITLWGRRSAFNVQKVLWLLGELGVEFEHRNAGGSFGGLDTPEFRAMNPHGKIPVLADGDTVVWESHAILRYLAASHGADRLWSPDPATRSLAERWMDWSQCTLQPAFMEMFWGYFRTPPARRDAAAIERARRACAEHFRLLDAELARRPFLAGAAFSLADVPAGTVLYRYFEMGLEVEHPPSVDAWYARLAARGPYRAAVMVPFAELRGRLEF